MSFLRFAVVTLCSFFALFAPSASFAANRSGLEWAAIENGVSPTFSSKENFQEEHQLLVENHSRFDLQIDKEKLVLQIEGYFDSVAVKGIDVRLISEDERDTIFAQSDRRGSVVFEGLKSDHWTVQVDGCQHEIATASEKITLSGESHIDVRLQKKISVLWMILTVLGGLGVFLLGMNSMSSGLQTVAGASLRRLVAALTSNRFFGLLVGLGVTGVVQSSSITTVMVVGFVNSGIMHLREAIAVIMGANLGTMVTAWIMVLAVDKLGLPLLGISAIIHLFAKQEKVRYAALVVMGIGMIFFGLELMKNGLGAMRESPAFLEAFSMFQPDSYFGVLKVAAVGCVLTMIIQSSSATIGIVIALASQGIVTFEVSVALVLGAKVGTTITAQLASLGAKADARRCAHFHTLYNLSGVIIATAIFPLFLDLNYWILNSGFGVNILWEGGRKMLSSANTALGIATAGTIFYILLTPLYLPFVAPLTRLLERLVKDRSPLGEAESELPRLSLLDAKLYDRPATALTISRHELIKMGRRTEEMADALEQYVLGKEKARNREEIFRGEAELDIALEQVTHYVAELLGEPLAESDIEEVKAQLKISDEHESISDYLAQILKHYLRLEAAAVALDQIQQSEILELHHIVSELIVDVSKLEERAHAVAYLPTMEAKGRLVTDRVRQLRDAHWARLSQGQLDPMISTVYGDLLSAYRKIKNHLMNVVEARAGLK